MFKQSVKDLEKTKLKGANVDICALFEKEIFSEIEIIRLNLRIKQGGKSEAFADRKI